MPFGFRKKKKKKENRSVRSVHADIIPRHHSPPPKKKIHYLRLKCYCSGGGGWICFRRMGKVVWGAYERGRQGVEVKPVLWGRYVQ